MSAGTAQPGADRRAAPERGVTMVELLIGLTLALIIAGPIVGAIYIGVRTTGDTETRLVRSMASNILASYLVPDVQGAGTADAPGEESPAACGAGATAVALLLDSPAAVPPRSVSYFLGTGADSTTLFRRVCSDGVAGAPIRVVRNLAGPVSFNCAPHGCNVTLTQQGADGSQPYQTRIEAARRAT